MSLKIRHKGESFLKIGLGLPVLKLPELVVKTPSQIRDLHHRSLSRKVWVYTAFFLLQYFRFGPMQFSEHFGIMCISEDISI